MSINTHTLVCAQRTKPINIVFFANSSLLQENLLHLQKVFCIWLGYGLFHTLEEVRNSDI